MSRKWAAFILALSLAIGGLVITVGHHASATSNPDPWPPFTMVYEHRRVGSSGQPISIIYRLDYRNIKSWRVEVLQNTSRPEEVGSWAEYNHNTMKSYDALFKWYREVPGPTEGYNVVDEWLIPNRAAHLLTKPGWRKVKPGEPGVLKVVNYQIRPCPANSTCTEERTYTADFNIPLSVRSLVDGKVVKEILVRSLLVHRNP